MMGNALRRSVFNRTSSHPWWPNLRLIQRNEIEAKRPIWDTVPGQSDTVLIAIAPFDTSVFLLQGAPVLLFQAFGLPDGLSIDSGSGIITGTPGTVSVFNPQMVATNDFGQDTAQFQWNITA